ncbi:YfjI family protein [Halomonas sp. GXIMD04776]|uniref:YfjI family protein n=1 Tax=Halomonas sp. GXIMD04776 TaxID=3415605 RepID=UPI003CB98CBE
MTGYHDIRNDIENSRTILPRYNSMEGPCLYGGVLIEKLADDLEATIKAPRGLIMAKIISAVSTCLQPLLDAQTPDGRIIPSSCYFIILAKSGERKSGVESKVFQPINDFQEKLDELYVERMRIYQRDLVVFEEKEKVLKKELRRSVAKGEDSEEAERKMHGLFEDWPKCPREMQLVYTDTTSEAFIDGMSRGCKYVAIASGEGGSVLSSAVMRDYPLLNSGYGGETLKKTRKTSGSSMVVGPRITISIDAQPDVFYALLEKNGEILHSSGFLARCFMAMPTSKVGSRYYMEMEHQEGHYEEYCKRLEGYLEKFLDVLSDEGSRRVKKLSEDAKKKMISIGNAIEHEMNPGGIFHGHEEYASKLTDKILRLACLLDSFENGLDSYICVDAVDHALHLGMYFAGQHLQIFKYTTKEEKEEELLLGWINKKRQEGMRYIRKNDVRRRVPTALRSSQKLNMTLERLEVRGEVCRYMANKTECVDVMPWLLVDHLMAMSLGGSGRIY